MEGAVVMDNSQTVFTAAGAAALVRRPDCKAFIIIIIIIIYSASDL